MKDAGSELVGDAGWGWGEWSIEAAKIVHVSFGLLGFGALVPADKSVIPGVVRLPMNLMEGVRSACAAAWRRTLVVNMVVLRRSGWLLEGLGDSLGRGAVGS